MVSVSVLHSFIITTASYRLKNYCQFFFSISLNHIWNKNKQTSLHSDELDLILADSGLGDGSQILAFESEPVESSETRHARVLDAGGVEIQGH